MHIIFELISLIFIFFGAVITINPAKIVGGDAFNYIISAEYGINFLLAGVIFAIFAVCSELIRFRKDYHANRVPNILESIEDKLKRLDINYDNNFKRDLLAEIKKLNINIEKISLLYNSASINMLKVSCPECGQHFEISESDKNKTFQCENCNASFTYCKNNNHGGK